MTEKDINGILRFNILSVIGVFLFLVPIDGAKVPIVLIINAVRSLFGNFLFWFVFLMLTWLMISLFLGKVKKIEPFASFHAKDGTQKVVFYIAAWVIIGIIQFHLIPDSIFDDPRIGGQVISLAGGVLLTVSIAGWLIYFMLKSGLVEFLGTLLEPVMRPLFRMPGQAAINCISAYMVSPAVGVLMADQYYQEGIYSRREAIAAMTGFSTVSVGYMAVLASLGNVGDYYGQMIPLLLLLVFVMTIIMNRIPPISNKYKDTYVKEMEHGNEKGSSRFNAAVELAVDRSKEFSLKTFFANFVPSVGVGLKIIANMIPLVTITLTIVYYTSVFQILGTPFVPLFHLLGLENAGLIAQCPLLGFIEVSLPAISISGQAVATSSCFFVVMLSMIQIVFMTEAGNAMLGSSVNLKITDLFLIFIVRTIIAIFLVAGIVHLIF